MTPDLLTWILDYLRTQGARETYPAQVGMLLDRHFSIPESDANRAEIRDMLADRFPSRPVTFGRGVRAFVVPFFAI